MVPYGLLIRVQMNNKFCEFAKIFEFFYDSALSGTVQSQSWALSRAALSQATCCPGQNKNTMYYQIWFKKKHNTSIVFTSGRCPACGSPANWYTYTMSSIPQYYLFLVPCWHFLATIVWLKTLSIWTLPLMIPLKYQSSSHKTCLTPLSLWFRGVIGPAE